MKLSTLYVTSLAFLPSFTFATAIPDVATRNETLAKRGGEVNYLANCLHYQTTWIPGDSYHVSHVAWYSNSDNSLNGQQPDSLSNEYRDWSRNGDYIIWEGSQQNIYFADSGVTVQTHIDADAQSRAFTDWAGWAQRTSDWKTFNCYKDNGRQLFEKTLPFPQKLVCNAIYWCV